MIFCCCPDQESKRGKENIHPPPSLTSRAAPISTATTSSELSVNIEMRKMKEKLMEQHPSQKQQQQIRQMRRQHLERVTNVPQHPEGSATATTKRKRFFSFSEKTRSSSSSSSSVGDLPSSSMKITSQFKETVDLGKKFEFREKGFGANELVLTKLISNPGYYRVVLFNCSKSKLLSFFSETSIISSASSGVSLSSSASGKKETIPAYSSNTTSNLMNAAIQMQKQSRSASATTFSLSNTTTSVANSTSWDLKANQKISNKLPALSKVENEFRIKEKSTVKVKINSSSISLFNNIFFFIIITRIGDLSDPMFTDEKTIFLPPLSSSSSSSASATPSMPSPTPNEAFVARDSCIPEEFFDPISLELMDDPVVIADGFTYSRCTIAAWLQKSDMSPLANTKLPSKEMMPNISMKNQILQFKQRNPELFKE